MSGTLASPKVCTHCEIELHCERNGVLVLEMATWGIIRGWASDLFKCPQCGLTLLGQFGFGPEMSDGAIDFQYLRKIMHEGSRLVFPYWVTTRERAMFVHDHGSLGEYIASRT